MRKITALCIIFMLFLTLTSCGDRITGYVGLNAEILEISSNLKGMVVKGLDSNSILGDACYINCEGEDTYFIYADYETGETINLDFRDFIVGDEILLDIKSVENKYALTSRVQLSTQRK